MRKAIVIVNLGSPSSLAAKDIWKFLTEFLNDARVIDLPLIVRKILVNAIIVPFRVRKSRNMYKQIWKEDGSPIIQHSLNLVDKLSRKMGDEYDIHLAMRYGKPNVKETLQEIYKKQYEEITIVPLFPHYASSTVGSIDEKVMRILAKWNNIPSIKFTSAFYNNPLFINAWVNNLSSYKLDDYDHILFSYHGLPIRHVDANHAENDNCNKCNCTMELNTSNVFCYKAQCYATSRMLSEGLNISEDKYTTCFQSRFSKNWLKPFADATIIDLANKGARRILVLPLSFVADCLETNYEIAKEYDELFRQHGGEKLTAVSSLNANDEWADALSKIITEKH